MKKLNTISILLILGIASVMFACYEDPGTDILLQGSFVEIQEATTSGGLDISKTYVKDGTPKKDSIRINLVGPHRSTPVVVTFNVDASSTAVAGFHYTMVTTGTTVTIAPNSSFAYIRFDVNSNNFNAFPETWKLKINITGTDAADVKLSENYKSFTRTMRI